MRLNLIIKNLINFKVKKTKTTQLLLLDRD